MRSVDDHSPIYTMYDPNMSMSQLWLHRYFPYLDGLALEGPPLPSLFWIAELLFGTGAAPITGILLWPASGKFEKKLARSW